MSHRPSLQLDSVEKGTDKQHRALLVAARVRDVIFCCECSKPHCVFSATRLLHAENIEVQRVRMRAHTHVVRHCSQTHITIDTLVVREALKYSSQVESTYYSSPRVSFEACCVYCGTTDELLDDQEVKETRQRYHTVRPLCLQCKIAGKKLVTHGPKNFSAKKPKT